MIRARCSRTLPQLALTRHDHDAMTGKAAGQRSSAGFQVLLSTNVSLALATRAGRTPRLGRAQNGGPFVGGSQVIRKTPRSGPDRDDVKKLVEPSISGEIGGKGRRIHQFSL
jgi:hypothetical protein